MSTLRRYDGQQDIKRDKSQHRAAAAAIILSYSLSCLTLKNVFDELMMSNKYWDEPCAVLFFLLPAILESRMTLTLILCLPLTLYFLKNI